MARVVWTLPAFSDLDRIAEFIAADAPFRASVFVEEILEVVDQLEDFPRIGRVIPEKNDPIFRELIFGNYRILYRLKDQLIEILSVVNSAQQLDIKKLQ